MNRKSLVAVVVVGLSACLGMAARAAQGPQLNRVMHQKLTHAQKILESVVTSDWAGLETNSRALEQLTADPAWAVLKYPEYARHSIAFVQAVQELHQSAKARDLEGAPKAYASMTLRCVECHRYLARARLAK